MGWNANDQVLVFDPYYHVDGPRIYTLNLNPENTATVFSNDNGFIEPLTITLNNTGSEMGFGFETVSQAPQVFITKTDKYKPEQITHFTNELSSPLGSMKTIHWKSTDGTEIEGLLMLPANYDPHKKYPLLVSVHGGPMGAWSKRYIGGCDDYETMIDPTTCWKNYLNLGFIIFQPNPRGSDGYGAKFRLANFADLGGGDFRDVMSGVDYLIKEGIADPDHMAIAGWSYGGYLSAWAITQTNRFKAAIEGDGNIDFISLSGTGLVHFSMEYFGNYFWDNDQLYLKRAPIMHTKNITTPLLIFYGQDDPRLPPSQGYEMYNALHLQHKTVKMLLLPKQGHVPTDPNMIEDSVKAINQWLEKYSLPKKTM